MENEAAGSMNADLERQEEKRILIQRDAVRELGVQKRGSSKDLQKTMAETPEASSASRGGREGKGATTAKWTRNMTRARGGRSQGCLGVGLGEITGVDEFDECDDAPSFIDAPTHSLICSEVHKNIKFDSAAKLHPVLAGITQQGAEIKRTTGIDSNRLASQSFQLMHDELGDVWNSVL
ncbi:hypothetical protein K438DRAFT_1751108 [Mycena galopus ATCC 62051]|nr:hypothetical protein K438DRAFT_1751108 [Mycena galopus ATCC 62051]